MQNFDRIGSNNSQLTNVENWVSSKIEVLELENLVGQLTSHSHIMHGHETSRRRGVSLNCNFDTDFMLISRYWRYVFVVDVFFLKNGYLLGNITWKQY